MSANRVAKPNLSEVAKLELRVPPVVVFLVSALAVWLLSRFVPVFRFVLPQKTIVTSTVAAFGIVLGVSGVATFQRAQTTVNPHAPTAATRLVTSGVYRFSRNPMYLALLLLLGAWTLYLGQPLSLILLIGFISYLTRFQIVPEERVLRAKFGAEFKRYTQRVRRWL